jgi:hypothetical protein
MIASPWRNMVVDRKLKKFTQSSYKLNFVNKQRSKHVNQLPYRVKKSAVRIKINFLSLRLALRQRLLDSLRVCIPQLSGRSFVGYMECI